MPVQEGKAAPTFTLPDAAGNKVALKSLRGRDVIVYFYPRDNTPGCTKEACGFRDLWDDVRQAGAVVLGISPDGQAAHQKFAAQHDLPFTLLSDPDKKVMEEYGAWGEKTLYGKKRSASSARPCGSAPTARSRSTGGASPRRRSIQPKCSKPCRPARSLTVRRASKRG